MADENALNELIKNIRERNNQTSWADFLREFAENSHFFIVAELDKNDKMNYKIIQDKSKNVFLPIFTKFKEYKDFSKRKVSEENVTKYDFDYLNEVTKFIPNLTGIVINPFSDDLAIAIDIIQELKRTKEKTKIEEEKKKPLTKEEVFRRNFVIKDINVENDKINKSDKEETKEVTNQEPEMLIPKKEDIKAIIDSYQKKKNLEQFKSNIKDDEDKSNIEKRELKVTQMPIVKVEPQVNNLNLFLFEWNQKNWLRFISNEEFDFAKKLVEKKYVIIQNTLNENKISVYSSLGVSEILEMNYDESKIEKESSQKYFLIYEQDVNSDNIFVEYNGTLRLAIFLIAGYIYYLKSKNKDNDIKSEREYYNSHKKDMDLKLLVEKELKNKEIEKNQSSLSNSIMEFNNKIDNIDELINLVELPEINYLYCTIENIFTDEQKCLLEKISELLTLNGKIRNTVYINLENVDELSSGCLYIINADENSKKYLDVVNKITTIEKDKYIILVGNSKNINELIELDNRFKFVYQNYRYKFQKIDILNYFEMFKSGLKSNLLDVVNKHEATYKFQFENYISINKSLVDMNIKDMISYLCNYSNIKDKVCFPDNIYEKEEFTKKLDDIVGLDEIKSQIKEIEKYILFKNKEDVLDIKIEPTNLNLIFSGNIGTGKRTVAKIYANMLYDLKKIEFKDIVEVQGKNLDFDIIEKSIGKIIYITKASSLLENSNKDIISFIINKMNENKENFSVIFSDTKENMSNLLKERIDIVDNVGYICNFDDYIVKDLEDILYKKIELSDMEIAKDAKKCVNEILKYFINTVGFENGKFIDKLFKIIIVNHSKNLPDDIKVIQKEDIPTTDDIINYKLNSFKNLIVNKVTKEEQRRSAVYEIGKAITNLVLNEETKVKLITITCGGKNILAYTVNSKCEENEFLNKSDIINEITILLSGIAAEKIYFKEFDISKKLDLNLAKKLAKNMILKYDIDDLELIKLSDDYNDEKLELEAQKVVDTCLKTALKLIETNKDKMNNVVKVLFKNKTITDEEIINNFK